MDHEPDALDIRHCARCRQEYETAVTHCSECGVRLADGHAPVVPPSPPDPLDATDDLVWIAGFPSEARTKLLEAELRRAGIATRVAASGSEIVGPFSGSVETTYVVLVPRDSAATARDIAARAFDSAWKDDDDGDDAGDPDSTPVEQPPDATLERTAALPGWLAWVGVALFCAAVSVVAQSLTPTTAASPMPSMAPGEDATFYAFGGLILGGIGGGALGLWASRRGDARRAVLVGLLALLVGGPLCLVVARLLTA